MLLVVRRNTRIQIRRYNSERAGAKVLKVLNFLEDGRSSIFAVTSAGDQR